MIRKQQLANSPGEGVLLRVIEMEPVEYDDAALLENVTNSRGMAAAQQSGDISLNLEP
ncbi:hypothetical protein Ms3S1_28880 [Methylosinus sp. 3S-1]